MKLKFGMIVTDGVNKIGGNVISKNHYGRFARRLVVPLNPQTAAQTTQRNNFLFLTQNFRSLTGVERALWAAACINYPRTDSLGNIYYPTAQTLYIEINRNLFLISQPLISVPPVKEIPMSFNITPGVIQVGVTNFVFYTDNGTAIGATDTLIYATRPMSPALTYVKSAYRLIAYRSINNSVLPQLIQVWSEYVAVFGVPTVNSQVYFQLRTVSRAGSQGIPSSDSMPVTP